MAEARSIYVGDLIDIRITTREYSQEELREKFKDFEIVKLEEYDDSFLITLRTFETGERKILLGDKELIIDVKSTLDEIQREEVFEGSLSHEEATTVTGWQYLLFIPPVIMLATGVILFTRHLKKRKTETLTPYQRFLRHTGNLSEQDEDFFVSLTYFLKQYLEEVYSCRIRGKTSTEILAVAVTLHGLQSLLPDLEEWLKEAVRLKFSGINVSREKKQELHIALNDLVRRIEAAKAADKEVEVAS
jgi:hypothetical protein